MKPRATCPALRTCGPPDLRLIFGAACTSAMPGADAQVLDAVSGWQRRSWATATRCRSRTLWGMGATIVGPQGSSSASESRAVGRGSSKRVRAVGRGSSKRVRAVGRSSGGRTQFGPSDAVRAVGRSSGRRTRGPALRTGLLLGAPLQRGGRRIPGGALVWHLRPKVGCGPTL